MKESVNGNQVNNSMYHVNLIGSWKTVNLSSLTLLGNELSLASGIDIVEGNIQSIVMGNIGMSHLFSALTVDSITNVTTFEMYDSIFYKNMDGIDLDQGVIYIIIARCIFEETRPWNPVEEPCCSVAVKATSFSIQVSDSSFRQNRAVGKYCNGSALSLAATKHEKATWTFNTVVSNQHLSQLNPMIKIESTTFFENAVVDCYLN